MEFKFPLLKLPLLCLQNILNESKVLELFDLINFSLLSKRCNRIVKQLAPRELQLYSIEIGEDHISISFKLERCWETWWQFTLIGDDEGEFPRMPFDLRTHGACEVMNINVHKSDVDSVMNAFRHFMDLFPKQNFYVGVNTSTESKKRFVSLGIDQCEIMYVFGENEVDNEDIAYLNNVKKTNALLLCALISEGFRFDQLNTPRLYIEDGRNLTRNMIFNSRIPALIASKCSLSNITPTDFLDFIKRWLESDDMEFVTLHIEWNCEIPQMDTTSLELHDYDPSRRGSTVILKHIPFEYYRTIDVSGGRDLKREDGLWATIAQNTDRILFHVWHEPFPDVDKKNDELIQLTYMF